MQTFTQIKFSTKFGREIRSSQTITKDQVIFVCELLILSQTDTVLVNTTQLQYYTFKFNDTQDCLVLGDGEIFNHSNTPNVTYDLIEEDGRFKMQFKALCDIEANVQLFIDYQKDVKVDTSQYINKNLVLVS